jgi:stearoyl-CoA desaturase (Delta-9 desaturase)
MALLIFFICHWYISLFFQSFFHHRYAAHNMYSMSKTWEKIFHVCCYFTQGSSYISASSYAMMHRLHHAHTDKDGDPHSPLFSPNLFMLMWRTRNYYHKIYKDKSCVDDKYKKDLPYWDSFDRLAHTWVSRLAWGLIYLVIYTQLVTVWWEYLFLPLTFAMGALQGSVVNWWAHKFGYENFKLNNTSKNIIPVDLFFVGESYHNNHHKYPGRPNNAIKWFEIDTTFQIARLLQWLHILRINHVTV